MDDTRYRLCRARNCPTRYRFPCKPVGIGGDISKGRAMRNPLALLGSGPAAGGIGAAELARQMGYKNVLLGDMGGTSFDAGLIQRSESVV